MELKDVIRITGVCKQGIEKAVKKGYIRRDSYNQYVPASVHNYKFVREVFTDYSPLLAGKFEEGWAMKDQKKHPGDYGCVITKRRGL